MTYIPKNWDAGDAVSVADMNHIETQVEEIAADLAIHDAAGHVIYYEKPTLESCFWNTGNDGAGSGLNVDMLEGVHAAAIQGGAPAGLMIFWNPNIALDPAWEFCDGQNGTYDMRGRFPIGASGTLSVGTAVGNATIALEGTVNVAGHTLTTQEIYHTHPYTDQSYTLTQWYVNTGAAGGYNANFAANGTPTAIVTSYVGGGQPHTHPGAFTGAAYDNLPVYKYLAIVRKK